MFFNKGPDSPEVEFPRIERLGFLADGETNFLISDGGVQWACLPEMDSGAVFSGILGGRGHFRVTPSGVDKPWEQRYLPGALVLETEWRNPNGGRLIVTDALVRTADGARQTLVRIIRCLKGKFLVGVDLEPVFDYGREPAQWKQGVARSREGLELRVATDLGRRSNGGGRIRARDTFEEGDVRYVALSWGDHQPPGTYQEAESLVTETIDCWRAWLAGGRVPDHPYGRASERSALILKGLCHYTGAIAAAGTTSFPEDPGGIRNWDYRFTWVRDGAMTAMALYRLGFREVADGLVRFYENLPGQDVQIMYGLRGETRLDEETLGHLPGYEGASPVRIGNGAYDQRQNDVWGQLIELIYQTQRDGNGQLPARTWRLVIRLVDGALKARGNPDRGIWEIRGVPRDFTSSLLYLWLALDRGSKLAKARGDDSRAHEWAQHADSIRDEILDGAGERGYFTASPGDEALDASCLLIPILGFPAPDEYVRATVHAVARGLEYKGLLLRYETTAFGDGLRGDEMAFVITAFWLVRAYVLIGERKLAADWYDRVMRYVGPLGVMAEEIDPDTGRHWGNFPQAFSHLGQIDAALDLIEATGQAENGNQENGR